MTYDPDNESAEHRFDLTRAQVRTIEQDLVAYGTQRLGLQEGRARELSRYAREALGLRARRLA